MAHMNEQKTFSQICFLDFDHTLFDTDAFFYHDMREAARRLGVGDECWNLSYQTVWGGGYSAEKHLREMIRISKNEVLAKEGMAAFENVFHRMPSHVYPDVVSFLTKARAKEIRLVLVSFGDPSWQEFKVNRSGLRPLLDECFFISKQGGKGDIISRESAGYRDSIFIDDNARELDVAKSLVPDLKTYWMHRSSKKNGSSGSDAATLSTLAAASAVPVMFTHTSCKNIDEVVI